MFEKLEERGEGDVQQSEDILRELVLSFYHVDSRDQTPVIKVGTQWLYPLSHLTSFKFYYYNRFLICLESIRKQNMKIFNQT